MEITITDRVRIALQRAGITKKQACDHLGMSQPTYRTRESGATDWTVEELRKLADLTRVDLKALVIGDE